MGWRLGLGWCTSGGTSGGSRSNRVGSQTRDEEYRQAGHEEADYPQAADTKGIGTGDAKSEAEHAKGCSRKAGHTQGQDSDTQGLRASSLRASSCRADAIR